MKAIWKFPLETTDFQVIRMPSDAEILAVQTQDGVPCIWAMVDTTDPPESRIFRIYGTGHPVNADEELAYVGTCQLHGGSLVFHIFEVKP